MSSNDSSPDPPADGSAEGTADDRPPLPSLTYCQGCGYDLRGSQSDRCPECGRSLDRLYAPCSPIPWINRCERGWLRSYWATVWLVTYDRPRLCEEMIRPVSYADASRFRLATVLCAWLPAVLVSIGLFVAVVSRDPLPPSQRKIWLEWISLGWPLLWLNVGLLCFLLTMTRAVSNFFHPRSIPVEQQNRAVALSAYTCAPLALAMMPAGLFILATVSDEAACVALVIGFVATVGLIGLRWWGTAVVVARRAIPQERGPAIRIGIAFPLLLLGLGIVCLVVLPALGFYVALIIASVLLTPPVRARGAAAGRPGGTPGRGTG